MASLASAIRVSLARTRADWPIVAAAGLITLLAAVLFSAGLIYPSAASEAGLRRPGWMTGISLLPESPSVPLQSQQICAGTAASEAEAAS